MNQFLRFDGLFELVHSLDRLPNDVIIGPCVQRWKLCDLWMLDQCFHVVYLVGFVVVKVVVDQRTTAEQVKQAVFKLGSSAVKKKEKHIDRPFDDHGGRL